ncbi:MAG: hypothetical protein KatS3mg042_1293 [Rhodothermaceae bacterium]|nr:MAG: hypothetical protein KatS3mg042_1293 [Rhodothermaceae bacterium]
MFERHPFTMPFTMAVKACRKTPKTPMKTAFTMHAPIGIVKP